MAGAGGAAIVARGEFSEVGQVESIALLHGQLIHPAVAFGQLPAAASQQYVRTFISLISPCMPAGGWNDLDCSMLLTCESHRVSRIWRAYRVGNVKNNGSESAAGYKYQSSKKLK